MADHQDWKTVTLTKNIRTKPKKAASLASAKASGQVETQRKYGNSNSVAGVSNAHKLENEDTDFKHQTVTLDFKLALQKARQAKGWTQKELAQKLNEKPTVINDYEAGRAIPNPQIISKLNRTLGVKLPKIPKKKKVRDD